MPINEYHINDLSDELPDELPDELRQAFRGHQRAVSVLTPAVDRAVLSQAEQHFSSRPSSQKSRLAAPAWVAIAASLVLAVFVVSNQETTTPLATSASMPLHADHDQSGQVDIADVLALARSANPPSQDELASFAQSLVMLKPKGDAS
jgi:hypothetical protein